MAVPPDPPSAEKPRQLSPAEAKAHLAQLHLVFQQRPEALALAGESLRADPANEQALGVSALANAEAANFEASLAAIDKLEALNSTSAARWTECGDALSALARAVFAKQATLNAGADALRARAKEAYERAISADANELSAWAGLAYLYADSRDNAEARALLPRAQPVLEKHPDSGALAHALAVMCAQNGQPSSALLFGEFWRTDAVSQHDLQQAAAFLEQVKTHR